MKILVFSGLVACCPVYAEFFLQGPSEPFSAEIEQILLNSGSEPLKSTSGKKSMPVNLRETKTLFKLPSLLNKPREQAFHSYLQHYLYSSFPQVLSNPSKTAAIDEETQLLYTTFLTTDEIPPYLPVAKGRGENNSFYQAAFEEYQTRYQHNKALGALGMGILYREGLGVTPSQEKALDYFKESAYLDNPIALTILGYFHHIGENSTPDRIQAIEYYKNALDQVSEETAAALLAEILLFSPQEDHDQEEGQKYLQQAIAKKVPYAFLIQGYYIYQQFLNHRQDTSKDVKKEQLKEALEWVEKANKHGIKATIDFEQTLQQQLENV